MDHPSSVTRGFIDTVINEGRLDRTPDFLADDSVHHELEAAAPDFTGGPEGIAEMIGLYRLAFSDLRCRVEDEVVGGDRVVTRFRLEGTHDGLLMGIAPSGRRMEVEGIRIDRVADGKIAESWVTWDALGLLRQIGALPAIERRPAAAVTAPVIVAEELSAGDVTMRRGRSNPHLVHAAER